MCLNERCLTKEYQKNLRRLRSYEMLFLAIIRFFSLPLLVQLTAEVDASNDEAAGSGKGMGAGRVDVFLLW